MDEVPITDRTADSGLSLVDTSTLKPVTIISAMSRGSEIRIRYPIPESTNSGIGLLPGINTSTEPADSVEVLAIKAKILNALSSDSGGSYLRTRMGSVMDNFITYQARVDLINDPIIRNFMGFRLSLLFEDFVSTDSIFNGLISSKEGVEKNQIKKTLIGNIMKILSESKSFDTDLSTITLDIGNYLLPETEPDVWRFFKY
jgi:hypothetical protein